MLRFPAAERNKEPILKILRQIIPKVEGFIKALEISSGSGQHAAFFAENLPSVIWQPSDCDEQCLQSIESYATSKKLPNLKPPLDIDVTVDPPSWASGRLKKGSFDLMLCVNLVHISPWTAAEGLFKGSGYYLTPGGRLVMYGPYKIHGVLTPESNIQFDRSLRAQNSAWGVRDVDDINQLAEKNGLEFLEMFDMPSNNKTLLFRKT